MRKIYFNLLLIVLFSLALASCKKEVTSKANDTSSLIIVNGVAGNNYLLTNFNGDHLNGIYYSGMNDILYGNFEFFRGYSGGQKLGLYQIPDTNANSKPVFNLALNLPVNTIHMLFLMGTAQDPDQLLTTDTLAYHPPSDSTMGIRFVNIAKGSAPVAVNLAGQANGSEAGNLPYKSLTRFKNFNAGSAISSYTFEFRDKATGELLGSCTVDGVNNDGSSSTPNFRRYRNFTIALLGASGGLAANRVLIIDEYRGF
ncbi:hypothetical protein [Mucilaginibacter sp.]|uniref:hypothetical protein n=1 Tax=Mucilaginibacter sp. TaxID=1882438 RepID=UPI002848203B|nr:hypothetical protein [Mucilaginibacter sp.]MDR3697039.1 hypothetical protein [Mucilaginibacter sp.]